jgi:hypothetical protein
MGLGDHPRREEHREPELAQPALLRHHRHSRLGAAVIQYLLGHASVVTTERYIHHTLAELSKATAVLENGRVFDALSDPKVGQPPSVADQSEATPSERTRNVH